jgi:hypothetical protein
VATVKQYGTRLWRAYRTLGRAMGVDLGSMPKETRVLVKATCAILGTLLKVLVDRNVVTDAQLEAGYAAAEVELYPDEPVDPPEEVP